ncbi:ATP-binding protein [Marinomonas sp. PE14-40]|uniref:ATP-binding protein n=1 Tax=Marinomonas sp. PE14-40 TaxID=3060621 RepID=UPI003F6730BA
MNLLSTLKLKYKLFIIFAVSNILIIGSMWQIYQWSFDQGFFNYVIQQDKSYLGQMANRSANLYIYYEDWDFLVSESRLEEDWKKAKLASTADMVPSPLTPNLDLIYPSQQYRKRFLLYNADKETLIGEIPFKYALTQKVKVAGEVVGYVGLRSLKEVVQHHTIEFVKKQAESFLLISAFMIAIVALFTWSLAKAMSRPICQMSQATRQLASGSYSTRLPTNSRDELGMLAFDLNHLASTLQNTTEARKRWVADTAHELRTPLAILRGEIEAMQDGIIKVTPDSLGSLLNETVHLGRLIEDLNQLSMHDTGNMDYKMEEHDVVDVLEQTVASMQRSFEEANLNLSLTFDKKRAIPITADANRLNQLFSNLMSNTLKYTSAPGELSIHVQKQKHAVVISFEDSAPGICSEDIEKIFERFYRTECSRNRKTGGRGLGLAICRSIVNGHRGTISSYSSSKQGLGIRIELPLT